MRANLNYSHCQARLRSVLVVQFDSIEDLPWRNSASFLASLAVSAVGLTAKDAKKLPQYRERNGLLITDYCSLLTARYSPILLSSSLFAG